ncbi:MAG: preprotein translocase subunit SecY [Enterobacteriaceae bacterium]
MNKIIFNNKYNLKEIKNRIWFVIASLLVFRLGSFIPIPGINLLSLTNLLSNQNGYIIEIFNIFSGGALNRASVFALGIMPYISSSIIVQLLTSINPYLSEMKKEGEYGRMKINNCIKYGTLILSIVQSIGIATTLISISYLRKFVVTSFLQFYITTVISLVGGTMILMWVGEQITNKGIGNGISIIIFAGILSNVPNSIINLINDLNYYKLSIFKFIFIIFLVYLITFFVVFVESGQKRIIVHYAKRQHGRRIYAAQSTHLPIKINMAGVIPAIFSSSIVLFPSTILYWLGNITKIKKFHILSLYFHPGKLVYMLLYILSIIFFCFFYTNLVFNSREISENLKKSGAFISGIRPGENTSKYIESIVNKLTWIGSFYVAFICLIPEFLKYLTNFKFSFGGTSLLIVVVVIMDFISQIQSLIMSSKYESILKKTHFKN